MLACLKCVDVNDLPLTMSHAMASVFFKLASVVLGDLEERPGKSQDCLTGAAPCGIGTA